MKIACVLALALLAAPALAQDEPADTDTIRVVGQREKERREEIRDFVGALSTEAENGPMSRFDTACPGVAGLAPAQNQAVAARMRRVAGAAGIPLADQGCQPNILVIVVPDKEEMLKGLKKKHPVLFRNGDNKPVEITREDGPALAWHISVQVDRQGQRLAVLNDPDMPRVPIVIVDGSNRLYSAYRPVSIGGIVLLEQAGIVGLTTDQIADYATMRAFSTIRPRRLTRANAPTILRLMDSKLGDQTPLSLTAWDLAFLKAAYAVPAYRDSGTQRAEMQTRIKDELKSDGRK